MGVALLAPSLTGVGTSPDTPVPPPQADAPAPPGETGALGNGLASQELKRSPDGHFYAVAQVNGARIRFMVDTGASIVALTPDDARRAGISLGSDRATVRGVGGDVEVIPVTIDRIAIGPLAARRVSGAVAEDLPISLLGQSFLSRADAVEIRGDRMVLR
ncbi:MAG: retropepsin-like aspartic protease family protein [Allosphingosinicella sp.]